MNPSDPLAVARQSLAQAQAYRPKSDLGRKMKAENIRQLRAHIAELEAEQSAAEQSGDPLAAALAQARAAHPAGGRRG